MECGFFLSSMRPKQGEAFELPSLLLIKQGRTFNESFPRVLRHRQPFSAEVIAEEIKTFLYTPDECVAGMFV